jgi:hypothetical protein
MISTVKEVKTFLRIATTTNDNLINLLIPIIENEIHEYTRNHFIKFDETVYIKNSTVSFNSTYNKIIDSENGFEDFKAKQTIKIFGSKYNNGICQISEVAEDGSYIIVSSDISIIDESVGNLVSIYKVTYPRELKLLLASMIRYKLNNTQDGLISESIDDYSRTYEQGMSMYPASIIKGLNKYTKIYKKEY